MQILPHAMQELLRMTPQGLCHWPGNSPPKERPAFVRMRNSERRVAAWHSWSDRFRARITPHLRNAAVCGAWPGSCRHKHDTCKRRNPKWHRICRSLESIRIEQLFRTPSTSCIERGIGRRTPRSCRLRTKAQRILRLNNALRPWRARRRERQRARWFALHWPGSFPFKPCRSTYWGRSSHLDRCWLLWLGPALAGRWVGSWGCWPACVCPNTSSSGTRAESGVAAFSYPFTATVRSDIPGEENLERHWRPEYLLSLGGCRRLRDDG